MNRSYTSSPPWCLHGAAGQLYFTYHQYILINTANFLVSYSPSEHETEQYNGLIIPHPATQETELSKNIAHDKTY
jgi:hypothetical protein